jgi:hypothetical protein
MSEYNLEQSEAIVMVQDHLKTLSGAELMNLKTKIESYLGFRKDVDDFQRRYFSGVCTHMCYQDHFSACCNREGIVTFFADVVINVLMSQDEEVEGLLHVLRLPNPGLKCIYLGRGGCLWRVKPIVCEMFLCEHARNTVFDKEPEGLRVWEELKGREKGYTWPDGPVLFDELEAYFIEKGHYSSLMYCHNSPGLLRVKAQSRKA